MLYHLTAYLIMAILSLIKPLSRPVDQATSFVDCAVKVLAFPPCIQRASQSSTG
jgi:hypothetical protein